MLQSPLRYPGGKVKLYDFFASLVQANKLYGIDEYCEPYAGGAGLAIKLLSHGFFRRISINDADPSIYAFWKCALEQTDAFCQLIESTDITVEEWHRQKHIWTEGDTSNSLKLGFATYFLNRTNRSGIIEGAGPIGGYGQSGRWKIDARLVKSKQIANLRSLSRYSCYISVSMLDAQEFIINKLKNSDNFLYLDPPYFVKGHKLYRNHYQKRDHEDIASIMLSAPLRRWMVSYDNHPEIIDMYPGMQKIFYTPNYSAGSKSLGSEIIFLSHLLNPPSLKGFDVAA